MRLERLRIRNTRNLSDVTLQPAPGLNLIHGPNAAGKTALLEAIYLLGRARSFRTRRVEEVVQRQTPYLQVSARLQHDADGTVEAGIERGSGHQVLRYNGAAMRTLSAHSRKFPLVVVTPESQQLVLGGPKMRRSWLDWAMFHVEPDYLEWWRDYHRALRQRNYLLKNSRSHKELPGWETAMARTGSQVNQAREQFITALGQAYQEIAATSPGPGNVEIRLQPGWPAGEPLQQVLERDRDQDARTGHTASGPHRADLKFRVAGLNAAAWYSRGQSKLFVALLMLAQARVLNGGEGGEPLLLVDDFAAELDEGGQKFLLERLGDRPGQSFLTTVSRDPAWRLPGGSGMFHVEHGKVAEMVE